MADPAIRLIDAGSPVPTDTESRRELAFQLAVSIDVEKERGLMLRVVVVVELVIGLIILREAAMLFLVGEP